MRLPELNDIPTERDMISVFNGYNHNLVIEENEFYDMRNMSSSSYPSLSPRKKRGILSSIKLNDESSYSLTSPEGILSKDALCVIDGKDVVINGYKIPDFVSDDESMLPKHIVSMGAYVIIFPDKKYINTPNMTSDKGSLEAKRVLKEGTVTFTVSDIDGVDYDAGIDKPESPADGQYWLDIENKSLKQYSADRGEWISVPVVYIKMTYDDIGETFNQYDAVYLDGITAAGVESLNQKTSVIYKTGSDYLLFVGLIDNAVQAAQSLSEASPVTVYRKVPDMDYICESQNRLWGCRYGIVGGNPVNEIYASKLGDPKNFYCYMGLSTDSYAVSVGSDGVFTGAATHLGYPIFFKENCFHKIYGSYPAQYQVQTTNARGVQKGSFRSLCTVNETLFYKSAKDIVAYDGSLPSGISAPLGNVYYKNAAAGSVGGKYYVSMQSSDGDWNMFVFDTEKGLWHKEDETQASMFCCHDNDLYFIDASDNKIKSVSSSSGTAEEDVEWFCESGIIGFEYPNNKYVSNFHIRMLPAKDAKVSAYIKYDSVGDWEHKGTVEGKTLRSFVLPVIPRRCDHFKIKLEGRGDVKIISFSKVLETGSSVV